MVIEIKKKKKPRCCVEKKKKQRLWKKSEGEFKRGPEREDPRVFNQICELWNRDRGLRHHLTAQTFPVLIKR